MKWVIVGVLVWICLVVEGWRYCPRGAVCENHVVDQVTPLTGLSERQCRQECYRAGSSCWMYRHSKSDGSCLFHDKVCPWSQWTAGGSEVTTFFKTKNDMLCTALDFHFCLRSRVRTVVCRPPAQARLRSKKRASITECLRDCLLKQCTTIHWIPDAKSAGGTCRVFDYICEDTEAEQSVSKFVDEYIVIPIGTACPQVNMTKYEWADLL